MKTLNDLELMKSVPTMQFDNQYNFLFMNLENDYIKSHKGRIKSVLNEWDDEAREFIIDELIRILLEGGMLASPEEIRKDLTE